MRNIYCGEINTLHINKEVKICGWVDQRKDLSNVIFIYMRDIQGIVQIVFSSSDKDLFNSANKLRQEFCIQVIGTVKKRPKNQINKNIKNGNIEIIAKKLNILNNSINLPINIKYENSENKRLKFRYLDLRRNSMVNNLKTRSKIYYLINKFMHSKKFINVETPILVKPSIEGAKNYIVSSSNHKNIVYALHQSPQIFKQLLMISGIDKYYQITKCFRDEDLRSDRQPEFTQVDIEMSFVKNNKIKNILESLIRYIWKKIFNIKLEKFQKLKYKDAIKRFGSDKPDLRNPMELNDLTYLLKCKKNLEKNYLVVLRIPKGNNISKEKIEAYINKNNLIKKNYLKFIKFNDITYCINNKILDKDIINKIMLYTNSNKNDAIILGIHNNKKLIIHDLGKIRLQIGIDYGITNTEIIKPLWITDFPMFKKDKTGKLVSYHHPFTAPKNLDIKKLMDSPMKALANSYDMIINGIEIGSGSIRINSLEIQKIIFNILNIDKIMQKETFGFFMEALKYGAPPHAGFAFGLDRLVMVITKENSIKNVIAFPKSNSAVDIMTS